MAVRTGKGALLATASCLHAVRHGASAAAEAMRMNLIIVLLLSQRFFETCLGAPEGEKAFLILVVGAGNGGLLLQYIAEQDGGSFEFVIHLAQLFVCCGARGFRHGKERPALGKLAETTVYVKQDLCTSLIQLIFALLDDGFFLLYFVSAPAPFKRLPAHLKAGGGDVLRQDCGVERGHVVE